MSQPLDPIPGYDPLIDNSKRMGERWYRWLSTVIARLLQAVLTVAPVHRASLTASVATTTIYTPAQPGCVRVSWTVQVLVPATTNSSIAVTLGWKANGVAQTEAFAALTTNLTTTHGSGSVTIRPDSANPITYATTYSSTGGVPMSYLLDVVVESLT